MKSSICYLLFFLTSLTIAQTQLGSTIQGEADFERMGWDVAMSGDGQTIIIGSPGSSITAYSAGRVKVLQFDGTDWIQLGNDILGTTDEDGLGRSVDITDDGLTVVVGTQYSDVGGFNSGSAQVFEYNGTDWIQKGNMLSGANSNDEFSTSISISDDGNRIAVGAPYTNTSEFDNGVLRIFDFDGSQWNQVFEHFGDEANDVFGMSLDMSGDGNHVICGAWINIDGTTKPGYAKVFEFDKSTWSQVGSTIVGEAAGLFTGSATSISDDGTIVAVGSWGNDENGTDSGEVEVFSLNGNTWEPLGQDIQGDSSFQRFGWAIDLSDAGNIIAIGAPQENDARFYQFDNGNWIQIGTAIPGENLIDDFGYAVDLSSDGTRVVIGDPNNDGEGSLYGLAQTYDLTAILSVDEFSLQEVTMFPNPVSKTLFIETDDIIDAYTIHDINGKQVRSVSEVISKDLSVDVSNLEKGLYFLSLQKSTQEISIKFIKN